MKSGSSSSQRNPSLCLIKKTDEFEQIIKDNIADYIDILKGLELIDAGYEG